MKYDRSEIIIVACVTIALWLMLQFGIHLGQKRNLDAHIPWNHRCELPCVFPTTENTPLERGVGKFAWHCDCGATGIHTVKIQIPIGLETRHER